MTTIRLAILAFLLAPTALWSAHTVVRGKTDLGACETNSTYYCVFVKSAPVTR